jgi:heptosyltransferase-2
MKSITWRLRNISLYLRARLFVLLHGKANRKLPAQPQKIIIVQGARLGDMVCTTPLFCSIKATYPTTKVTVVGDAVNEKLLAGHPDIDNYIVWKDNFSEVLAKLRAERADYGFVCLPSLEGLALLILSGTRFVAAPKISGGVSPYETSTYRSLLSLVHIVPHYFDHYAPREYLRLLEPIDIVTEDTTKKLTFSPEALMGARKTLQAAGVMPGEKLVGILPGVGGLSFKVWAPEKFAKIADYVTERYGARVIILGSGKNADAVNATISKIAPQTNAVNLFDKLSLDELKALISTLTLFVSADTGPMYIAEAFGVPTVDIVGPIKEQVQPPRGKKHKVVFVTRERGMVGIVDSIAPDMDEARRQSDEITVEMVTTAIDELLA